MKTLALSAIAILAAASGLRADPVSDGVKLVSLAPKQATYPTDPANAAFWQANLPAVKAAVDAFLAGPERAPTPREQTLAAVWYFYGANSTNSKANIELLRRFRLESQMLRLAVVTPGDYASLKANGWVLNGLPITTANKRFIVAARFRDWPEAEAIFNENRDDPSFWSDGNVHPQFRAMFAWKTSGKTAREVYDAALALAAQLESVAEAKPAVEFLNSVADSRYLILQRQRALESAGQ